MTRFTVRLHFYVLGRLVKARVVLTCTVGSLAQSPSGCGQRQTTNHIVDTCPLTKFEGGLNLLHEADDDAVIWLESTATAALAKYINKLVSHAKMAEPIEMPFCGTDSCGPKASYIAAVFKLGSADQRGSATGSHGVRERIPKSSNCLHGF